MNKNTLLRPLALMTLLAQVKTAPTVQNQFDLLLKVGEFKAFTIRPLSNQEKVKICGLCGSATTPFGSFGNGLVLDFSVYGFRLLFHSREIWKGGQAILSHLLEDPSYFSPGINKAVDRLRYHRFLIRPFLNKVGSAVALMSVGLNSYPGLPANGQEVRPVKSVVQDKVAEPVPWISVKITSYSWRETDHVPFGKHNCIGGDLTVLVEGLKQCAADLSFYPLGTIIFIKAGQTEEFRIVTDCGRAVKGPHHLDLHFDSLDEMNSEGTRHALVMVIRHGW